MGKGMDKFLSIQRGVGKVGATYDAVGSIVGGILFAIIGIVCITMGVKHTKFSITSRSDEFCKDNASSCPEGCENKGSKCVPTLKDEKAGTVFIVAGVFFLIIAALIVWSGLFWRRAVYKNKGVATVGGFLFEAQLLNDLFR